MYKVAVIGLGGMGMIMETDQKRASPSTHAFAFSEREDVEHLYLCDIDESRLKKAEDVFGSRASYYSDYKELLWLPIDLVVVATPPETHVSVITSFAEHSINLILCEKPLSPNKRDAEFAIKACREHQVRLLIGHQRRYFPLLHEVRDLLVSGKLGTPRQVACYYTAGILNSGSHLFDLLRLLFGEVSSVWGVDNPLIPCSSGDINIDGFIFFEQGLRASIQSLEVKDYVMFDIDIYCSKGCLKITDFGMRYEVRDVVDCPSFSGYKSLSNERRIESNHESMTKYLADYAISCLRTGCDVDNEDALKTLDVIWKLKESEGKIVCLN